jgi:hypothetical protein
MRKARAITTGVLFLAVAGLGACGDDDDNEAASGNLERYCELARTLAEPPEDVDFDTATPEELTDAIKKHFSENSANIDELEEVAPEAIADDITVYARVARHIADTGDISEFDKAENAPAIRRQENFDRDECGLEPPGG